MSIQPTTGPSKNEGVTNEQPVDAPRSRLAGVSFRLGVLSLFLLLLSLCWDLPALTRMVQPHDQGYTQEQLTRSSGAAFVCSWMAFVAAVAAIIVGIIALVDTGRGGGKLKGRGLAVQGMVTSSLTLLPFVLVYGVLPLMLALKSKEPESATNLKVLGLAMMIYHDSYGHLPPAVLRDPGLGDRAQPYSWRVALLPILGEENLFQQYRRDEPWDSPANKVVLARMPRVFAPPGSVGAADGLTHYQVLVGPGTAFERPDVRVRLSDFPRGAAQTILVVEAAVPVPWTKPEDLSYTPDGPLPKVGGVVGNGFHALFADGTVRWFEAAEAEITLRTLVPRNGREVTTNPQSRR